MTKRHFYQLQFESGQTCVLKPCSGYHYYRRELDAMSDPAAMHARRGAHWTFNAAAFLAAMRRVRLTSY